MKDRPWEVWDKEHVSRLTKDGWASQERIRKGAIIAKVLDNVEGRSVLDVGCGVGRYAHWFRSLPHIYLGVDSSESMLAVARERYPDMRFEMGDVIDLSPVDQHDTVIGIALLIHLPDIGKALEELWSRTRKCLMVTVKLGPEGEEGTSEMRRYKWHNGDETMFPKGKHLIIHAETKARFDALTSSLPGVESVENWDIVESVEGWDIDRVQLYKIGRR